MVVLASLLAGVPSQAADQPHVSKRVPLPARWADRPDPIAPGVASDIPSCADVAQPDAGSSPSTRFLCTDEKPASHKNRLAVQAIPKVWCASLTPQKIWGRRDGICYQNGFTYTVKDGQGRPRGKAQFILQTELTMKATQDGPPKVREHMDIKKLNSSGEAKDLTLKFTSTCKACAKKTGSIWKDYSKLPTGKLKQKNAYRAVHVAKGAVKDTTWKWQLSIKHPMIKKASTYTWGGHTVHVRCDNQIAKNFGCVWPDGIPTLGLDVAKYKAGALFVARAQQENKHHWGMEKYKKPLTRLAVEEEAQANRDVICPDGWARDSRVEDPSCDEFPFARSRQSGGNKVKSGDECEQRTTVHVVEDDGSEFLEVPPVDKDGNVLDKGDPDALCVRATTPNGQNKAVGSALGGFTKTSRLLNKDKYYVYVYDSSLSK